MNRIYKNNQERLMMEALEIIGGARRQTYGSPERNFQRIALIWNGYLSAAFDQPVQLGAHDVCHMLDLVKLARLIESPDHEDSMRDRFGYMGCYVDLMYGDGEGEAGWQEWPEATTPHEPEVDPPQDEQVVDLGSWRVAVKNGGDE